MERFHSISFSKSKKDCLETLKWLLLSTILIMLVSPTAGCKKKIKRRKANVLLITVDTLRADRLNCYGYPYIQTPVIDGLASKGVLFERAMTTVPLTLPSHATILTGLYPPSHGVRHNGQFKLPDEVVTLPEILREKGYRTGAVVGSFVLDRIFGLDQGFGTYDDSGMSKSGLEKTSLFPERTADRVTDHALAWLNDLNGAEPFFIWVHYYDPHALYRPPAPFDEKYRASPYDGEIAFVDSEMKRLLDGAHNAGPSLPLVVVFVSDHGESFGEHGELTHGLFVYNSTMHVPLIISSPKILPKGVRINTQVRTVDITPTILDMLGLSIPGWMQGTSLLNFLGGERPDEDLPAYMETLMPLYQYGWSELKALAAHGYVYIESPDPELYDIRVDFAQANDLAKVQKDTTRRISNLLRLLKRKISRESFQRAALAEDVSSAVQEKLLALGYITTGPAPKSTEEVPLEARPNPRDYIKLHAMHMKVMLKLAEKKASEATALIKGLLKDDPHSPAFLTLAARAAYMDKRADEARGYLVKAIELDHRNTMAISTLARVEFGEGYFEKAKVLYEMLLEITPFNSQAYRQLGKIALKKGDKKEAKKYFEKALELLPREMEALELLENILSEEGNIEKVKKLLDRALEKAPTETEVLKKAAILRDRMGDREGAIALFRKVVNLNPRSAKDIYNLGAAILKGNDGKRFGPGSDPEAALKLFYEAIRLDPKLKKAHQRIREVESR